MALGPKACGKAVGGSVREFHHFVLTLEGANRDDRTEDLFAVDRVSGITPFDDSRAQKVPLRKTVGALPSARQFARGFDSGEIARHLFPMALTNQRSHLRSEIERIPYAESAGLFDELGDKRRVDRF